jgi:hypothetical protein
MPYGYHGRILRVDLTRGSLEVEEPSESWDWPGWRICSSRIVRSGGPTAGSDDPLRAKRKTTLKRETILAGIHHESLYLCPAPLSFAKARHHLLSYLPHPS